MQSQRQPRGQRRQITLTADTLLGAVLAAVFGVVLVWFVWTTRQVWIWILLALVFALALDYVVSLLERWLPRLAASLLAWLGSLLVIGGAFYLVVPPLVEQVRDLVEEAPELVDRLSEGEGPLGFLERRFNLISRLESSFAEQGGSLTEPIFAVVETAVTALIGVVAIVFLTVFMLVNGPSWKQAFIGRLPQDKQRLGESIADGVRRAVGGWAVGAAVVALAAGTSTFIVLVILGVPYPLALAAVVALLDPIPFVGITLAGLIVGLVTWATAGLTEALIVIGFITAYQQLVENHVLVPLVYQRTVQVSALGVLIALLLGGAVAGVLGVLLAIPFAGAVKVVFNEVWDWRQAKRLELSPAEARDPGSTVRAVEDEEE